MIKKMIRTLAAILCFSVIITSFPAYAQEVGDEKTEVQNTVAAPEQESEELRYISEIEEKRTSNTKTFLMSDRTETVAVYNTPVHYKKDGKWEDINNSFTSVEGDVENTANIFKTKFAKKSNKTHLAELSKDGYKIKWSLPGCNKVSAEYTAPTDGAGSGNISALKNIAGNVIYKSILTDTDIEYNVSAAGLKENIILTSPDAPQEFSFNYEYKDLKCVKKDGSIVFCNSKDETVFEFDKLYMYDAARVASEEIDAEITETKKGAVITVKPDKEWLNSADREWPVVIDPGVVGSQKATEIWDIDMRNTQSAAFNYKAADMLVGSNGGDKIYRSLVRFPNLPDIGNNSTIVSAKVNVTAYQGQLSESNPVLRTRPTDKINVCVHRVTADWPEQGAVWNPYANNYHPEVEDFFVYNNTDNGFSADITDMVSGWYNSSFPNYGLILKEESEGAANHVMQFTSSDWGAENSNASTWRPVLTINYRDCTGLEDYWSYTNISGDKSVGYVNNYNGNFICSLLDTSYNSDINGFSVSHIYNSSNVINNYGSTVVKYGNGWSINMMQRLLSPTEINGNNSVKYVYIDGDGTRHYLLQTDDGSIVDEDGLGYTYADINEGELSKKLTDKDGNILKFDLWGYLRRIVDTNNNTISINYSPLPGANNYISSITTSSGGQVIFNYDENHRLTSIKDNAGRTETFEYSGDNLTKVTYPDGTAQRFTYSAGGRIEKVTNTDNSGFTVSYDGRNRVAELKEIASDGSSGASKTFGYGNNLSKITDNKGRTMTYQFDTFGRTTCIYDNLNNSYSQSYTPTNTSRSKIFANNKITLSSNNTKYINNLLTNPCFSDGLSNWTTYNANATFSVISEQTHLSSKSAKIVNSGGGTACIMQSPPSEGGKTYTFSGYFKTEDVTPKENLGAGLEIVTTSPSGSNWYYSDFLTGTTNSEIDNGFVKLDLTVTLGSGESILRATAGLYNASGTCIINALQLEEGDTANQINFITNSGFENDANGSTAPSGYAAAQYAAVSSDCAVSGSKSYRISGKPGLNLVATQSVSQSGKAGDVFSFGGWAKAKSVPSKGDDRLFKLVLGVNHSGGTEWHDVNFNEHTNDWQCGTNTVVTKHNYTSLTLYICYYQNCNTAYFDDIFLYKDTAESYTYDGNGNVISTADNAKQSTEYQYKNNSLSKIINPTGTCYEYFYDSKKNLILSKSSEGLQCEFKYDSHGNAVSSVTYASNASSLNVGESYYIRNKLSGKYIDLSGDNCVQKTYSGSNSQQWKLIKNSNGSYSLSNNSNSQSGYMTVVNADSANDTNVNTYTPHNNNAFVLKAQSLKIELADKAAYKILTAAGSYSSCVEVAGNDRSENANISQYSYAATDAQHWYFEKVSSYTKSSSDLKPEKSVKAGETYYIRNKLSGKFLDYTKDGTNTKCVQQNLYDNRNTQKWYVYDNGNGTYRLRAVDGEDNTYLCVNNASSSNNTPIGVYGANFGNDFVNTAECLKISSDGDSCFKILTKASGYNGCVEVENSSASVGAQIKQNAYSGSDSQKWEFIKATRQPEDNTIYQFRARHSGRYIAVNNQETAVGTKLDQYFQSYLDCQKFIVKKYGDTQYYTITPYHALDKLVNVSADLTSYGCEYVELGSNEITDSKLFKFTYNPQKGAYQICPKSNLNECLDVAYADYNDSANIITAENGTADNKFFVLEKLSSSITSSATYQDNGNFIKTTTDSRGKTTTYDYDTVRGLQTAVTDPKGNKTNYAYESSSDRLLSVSSGKSAVNYSYDNSGKLTKITSPGGTQYGFEYDAFGKTSKIKVGSRTLTQNVYENNNGNLLYSLYGNGAKVGYTYDSLDRVTEKLYNDTVKIKYKYDRFGNLYSKEDLFTGTTYRYNYDLSGRTLGISANNGTAVKFVYDNFNRVSKQISAVQNETLTTEYLYGTAEDGRLNGVLYGIKQNGQNSISNTYDELARVNKRIVDATNSYETEYTYLEGGDPNTTTTVIKTVKNGSDTLEYSYDDVGNITEIKKNGITVQKYSYDSLNQLVTATYGGHTYTYAYDNAGNILSVKKDGTEVKTYGYGDSEWKDLLTEFNGDTITYDQIGNPLSYRNGFNFTWSNGRQLTSVTRGETNVSYLYNADGMRTQKTINGITTDYYYLNGVLQAQKTGDEYIIFLYDENGSAYGMIIKNGETVANYYYLFNAQGDVIGIIDQNGEQVVAYEYGAWGDVTSTTGSLAQTVGAKNPIRYRGYYYDGETGFYYLQSRYYDPYTARFINADGYVSTGQGIIGNNMFAYCGNNPINNNDNNGMFWGKVGRWFKKAWRSVVSFAKKTFGAGSTTTTTISKYREDYISDPMPFTLKSGKNLVKTNSKRGNSTKPVSVYANKETTHPIKSSSAGVKFNIDKYSAIISFGLDNVGIYATSTEGDETNSLGVRLNISKLKVGIEASTTTAKKWDEAETVYSNGSFSLWFLAALYGYVTVPDSSSALSPAFGG